MSIRRVIASVLPLLAAAGLGACGTSSDASTSGTTCSEVKVDAYKELVIVDEDVLGDARAKNASDGVWSFRHAIENMAPVGGDVSEFVRTWLVSWVETKSLNGYDLDRPGESRVASMNRQILCPWLKRTPENACDDACTTCAGKKLDLATAPFRLIAITNRMDQRDEVASEPFGESRLLFAATNGVGDDPATPALPMSLIFEYRLPETRSLVEWAKAWHELGSFESTGEPYRAALEGVTNAFVKRGADPKGISGSALAQIRTNESALNWIWQLREFALDGTGQLRMRPLRNTPPAQLNNSKVLRDFVLANKDAIMASRFEMPDALRAGSADQLLYTWSLPDVDEATRKAFAQNTCNGCHSREHPSVDTAFHVSPFRSGVDKVSKHLEGELAPRTAKVQRALCTGT